MDWLLVIAVFGMISADTRIERVSESQCRALLAHAVKHPDDRVKVGCLSPDGNWVDWGLTQ